MSNLIYLSLGSNLGDRADNLRAAIASLSSLGDVMAVSSFYETEPVELEDQPWFLNCAVALRTLCTPQQLLEGILGIERNMGRERKVKKGPRVIDIDILLYGAQMVHADGLEIPHPAMHDRLFVLVPLAEIAPKVHHPVLRKSIRELRDGLRGKGPVVRLSSAK